MPARWQSSQKPLFVRTVWVAGRRHAILSRDDPLLRCPRPPSSTSVTDTASEGDACCRLEDCLIKLRLALRPDSYQESFRESIYPIRHGTVESSYCFDHEDSDSLYDEDLPPQKLPLLGQYPKVYSFDGNEHAPFLPELQLNPLSERVLQWLDLSGKGKKINTTPLQRGVGQTERRKSSTTADVRKTHTSRRKELQTRSLSVDVLANMKLTARSIDTQMMNRKQSYPKTVSPQSSDQEDNQKRSPEEPPVVQNFEPPRLLRTVNSWPPPSSPNRPQLHIFMPPLDHEVHPEESEAEEGLLDQ